MDQKFEMLRIWADALYDHQGVRIASLNRVRCLIRRRLLGLGFEPEGKKVEDNGEPTWNDKDLFLLLSKAESEGKLSEADHDFLTKAWETANSENSVEQSYEKLLNPLVKKEEIWIEWLAYVKGISTRNLCRLLKYFQYCEVSIIDTESGKVIGRESGNKQKFEKAIKLYRDEKELDLEEARYRLVGFETVSKLWAYCGLAPKDGKAIKRKKGEKLPYNMKIKTAMVGVIGDSLIKASGKYKKVIYDDYKKRIFERSRGCCDNPKCKGKPGHAHNMARRKMVKIFLSHYWETTRTIKGLNTRPAYVFEKLGHKTHHNPFYDTPKEDEKKGVK